MLKYLRSTLIPFTNIRRNFAFNQYDTLEVMKKNQRMLSTGAYLLLVFPVTSFGLGVWQVFRRRQKLIMLDEMAGRMNLDPVPLPQDLRQLRDMEYTPIRLVGEFDHEKEFIIKPRARFDSHFKKSLKGTTFFNLATPFGGIVVAPFKLAHRDFSVLVVRGWLPLEMCNEETLSNSRIKGQVEVVGITRNPEKRPRFVDKSSPEIDFYPYRDVESMAQYHNTAPAYFELVYENSVPDGPIAGQTRVNIPNEHNSYILTWFGLSLSTSYLWYRRYIRNRLLTLK